MKRLSNRFIIVDYLWRKLFLLEKGLWRLYFGLDAEILKGIANDIAELGEVAEPANLNCPGQVVISGTAKGIELAGAKAKEAGAKRVLPLQVSGPFHSSLMKPAAEKLSVLLAEKDIRMQRYQSLQMFRLQRVMRQPCSREQLVEQVYSSVRWEESIRRLIELGVDTFIEIGLVMC